MGSRFVYILRMDGVERRGTVDELCSFTEYTKGAFYQFANGRAKCPEGIYIGREVTVQSENLKRKEVWKDWDKTMAMFNNVKWVKSGGRRLSQ